MFVDLEKAFDTVNHMILTEKLNWYGFRGQINLLLKSYLNNRKQFVSINGFDSKKLTPLNVKFPRVHVWVPYYF